MDVHPASNRPSAPQPKQQDGKDRSIVVEVAPELDLDFAGAWSCIRESWIENGFEPFYSELIELIDTHAQPWFEHLEASIATGSYRASTIVSDRPYTSSRRLGVRSPRHLVPDDEMLYTAAVLHCMPALLRDGVNHASICGPVFLSNGSGLQWPVNKECWFQLYIGTSQARVEQGAAYVANTDVSNFFGSIDHDLLLKRLLEAGAPRAAAELLHALLGAWLPGGVGVPWTDASHVLAASYLLPVDRALQQRGFEFIRLVDDYRFFCNDRSEAEEALKITATELAKLKLSHNSDKTHIFSQGGFEWHSATLPLHRLAARGICNTIAVADRMGLRPVSAALRSWAMHWLNASPRSYLGRLLAGTPVLDPYLLALVEDKLPGGYLHFAVEEIKKRNQLAISRQTLSKIAVVAAGTNRSDSKHSVARKLLALLRRHQGLVVTLALDETDWPSAYLTSGSPDNEFVQLEALLCCDILSDDDRSKLLLELRPIGFLSRIALEAQRSPNSR